MASVDPMMADADSYLGYQGSGTGGFTKVWRWKPKSPNHLPQNHL